jgi:CheY-like chemotaxis protein
MLEAQGYRVLTAADGNLGFDMAKKHQPDAITLDVVMPGGLDGWEVLNRLKDYEATQSIPVVMVSVMAEQENGSALDVEDYLVKPIDMNRLSRVIERATGQSNSQSLLLVDDDSASLEAMRRILEEAGWKTSQASDGAEALEELEKNRPAAIVLDLLMPVMDGFEFLEKLQANDQLSAIPVIVLSGKDPSEKEQRFLRERVTTVLKKDQRSADELIATINDRIRDRIDR